MHADKVDVAWDGSKNKWLVRIEAGTEVIRRSCNHARDVDEQQLRTAAKQTVIDEGYEVEESRITVVRESSPSKTAKH
jgi:hypothetical protein